MTSIHKFELEIIDRQVFGIRNYEKMLSVIEQRGKLVVYAMVDAWEGPTDIEFAVIGTGRPVGECDSEGWKFLGTVSTCGGGLIWHVFYRKSGGGNAD